MSIIPTIDIFVRHTENCLHRDDEHWKRCHCRKHLRWTWEGKQHRKTAKTRSWAAAERARRELELKYEGSQRTSAEVSDRPTTIEQAISSFMAEKRGAKSAAGTLAKYKDARPIAGLL